MCVRAAYTHLPRGSKQPKSETREMNRRTVAGVQRVAEGKRKRLDFPPPVEKESRRFSPVPNPPEDQVSPLGSPPRTALTLSSGSPRFSSAILFSIVFVTFFFGGLLLPKLLLPVLTDDDDGYGDDQKPRNGCT